MTRRRRAAGVVTLVLLLGPGLLAAACSRQADQADHAASARADRSPTRPTPDEAASSAETAGAGTRLEPSVPRRPATAPGASPGGTTDRYAARGESLPAQWSPFRPTRVRLRPGGPVASVVPQPVTAGMLGLPVDADRVGWWRGGSPAAAPFGTVVVAGHLDSATDPSGYLAGLAGLADGDVVELSAPGEVQRYRVQRNFLLASADLSRRSDLFEQDRAHRLVLVTCGGPYDEAAGRYRDNRVVEAVPVD